MNMPFIPWLNDSERHYSGNHSDDSKCAKKDVAFSGCHGWLGDEFFVLVLKTSYRVNNERARVCSLRER